MFYRTTSQTIQNLFDSPQVQRIICGEDVVEDPAIQNVSVPEGVLMTPVTSGETQMMMISLFPGHPEFVNFGMMVGPSFRKTWLEEV